MHIVIIGNGISGVTTARFIRKLSEHKITVISVETDYFFSRTALMYIYMGHMRAEDTKPYEDFFWKKNRIDLVRAYVEKVDFDKKSLALIPVDNGPSKLSSPPSSISYDKLVLATGSVPNKFGWPGQDLQGVGQLYSFQDLLDLEAQSGHIQSAVIVGGGLIGIELAEMLHSRHKKVTMLVREENYWDNVLPDEEAKMVNRHIRDHGVDLRLSTELDEILDDGHGRVRAVRTKDGEEIDCQYVGLTVGVRPNVDFLKDSVLDIQKGIVVDDYFRTNIPDVYAIGDCAQLDNPKEGRRPIEAVWYTGRMMGETLAYTLCGEPKPYDPGIWFNSAKFMDIEYQVYGHVPTQIEDNDLSILWMSIDGKKSVRIHADKESRTVLGFNLMGVRFRHETCEEWIRSKASLDEVVGQLEKAFFDPEFHEDTLIQIKERLVRHVDGSLRPPKNTPWTTFLTTLKP